MNGENEGKSTLEESRAVAELATEAIGPLEQELRERVPLEFSERDLLAIESALLKAFVGGMQAAMGEIAEATLDQLAPGQRAGTPPWSATSAASLPLPRLDPWAARYRDG